MDFKRDLNASIRIYKQLYFQHLLFLLISSNSLAEAYVHEVAFLRESSSEGDHHTIIDGL